MTYGGESQDLWLPLRPLTKLDRKCCGPAKTTEEIDRNLVEAKLRQMFFGCSNAETPGPG